MFVKLYLISVLIFFLLIACTIYYIVIDLKKTRRLAAQSTKKAPLLRNLTIRIILAILFLLAFPYIAFICLEIWFIPKFEASFASSQGLNAIPITPVTHSLYLTLITAVLFLLVTLLVVFFSYFKQRDNNTTVIFFIQLIPFIFLLISLFFFIFSP